MSTPIDIIVGQNLRVIRIKKGFSQGQLADAVGVSFQQIQKYERGSNRISASRLVEMATALGCQLDELFAGVGENLQLNDNCKLSDIRREQKVIESYNQLPEDMQVAVANLVTALFINVGQKLKKGAV